MSGSERKLAAIMFTDVVGFTAFGQRDEHAALSLLEGYRQLLRPIFNKHRGREVKTIGDGFLVEFGSALEATLCAIDIQTSVHSQNLERSEKLNVRIGIHLGDVVHQDSDVLGDAVNVASRIEPLAEPGGICISGQVYDHVKSKVSYPLIKLDARQLKNVSERVEVYSVVLPWEGELVRGQPAPELDQKRVAVLPLVSMSPDPNDEFFADGITEELISTMSNIAGLQVISRTSVMHFKRTTKTMNEIARDLSAGSIVEGSVRRAGNRVRVTVQLIDTNTDTHLWANNYDRQLEDIFAIQSDVSTNVAESLKVHLLDNEKERIKKATTSSTEAHLLYLKGRYFWNERTKEGLERALEYFKMATEKDPNYALAYSGIADTYSVLSDHGYLSNEVASAEAQKNAAKAVELDGSLSETHASLGLARHSEVDRGRDELMRALTINPNNAFANLWYSITAPTKEEGVSYAEKAAKLDPLNLQIGSTLGASYYLAMRFGDAIKQLEKVVEMGPDFAPAHYFLGRAYLENGQPDEAIKEARIAGSLRPTSIVQFATILAAAGEKEEARRIVEEAKVAGFYTDPADLAWAYGALGETEKEASFVEQAARESSAHLGYYSSDPSTREMRKDPRIRSILERAGYPQTSE